jgi:hypothetical protein
VQAVNSKGGGGGASNTHAEHDDGSDE